MERRRRLRDLVAGLHPCLQLDNRSSTVRPRRSILSTEQPPGHLGARSEAEFAQDVLDVDFDGAFADHQPVGDLAIAQSVRNQPRYLALTPGEGIRRRWAARSLLWTREICL